MKVVLSSRGSRGDVNPIMEVASYLNKSGHNTLTCVPEIFGDYCEELGIEHSLYPEDSKQVMENMGSGLGSLNGAFDFFSRSIEDQFNFMMDETSDADALITTINEIAGPTIAEYYKIPHYRVGFSPILPGKQAPPFMPWQNMSPFFNKLGWSGLNLFSKKVIKKFLNKKRVELGLKAVRDSNYYHTGNSHTLLAINPELSPPCKSWENRYKYDYTGYCYGQINGELDAELLDFINAGDPPIYVGFGSVQIDNNMQFTDIIFKVVKQLKCRVILGKGWTGLGNTQNHKDIFYIGDSNHGSLFPKLAGIVHHGGSGTTHTAARAGIPQFILPQFYDQYFWGNAIYKKSMGPKPVIPKKLTAEKMSKAFQEMLNGKYNASAQKLSENMQNEDGIQKIAEIVMQNGSLR